MIAAIYARKSTEQNSVPDEAKSVTRQIANAKAFALARGWTVAERYIFVDDGISGAEFDKRPGLQRLLRLLKPKAPFGVVVVAEQKALGRESYETNYLVKQLSQAGVEVVSYSDGRSLTPNNWLDKVTSGVLSAVDEGHREQTRERTHEAHAAKHKRGHVVGGRVFGYRNVDIFVGEDAHGRPLRGHVERRINEAEAATVLRLFEMYDSGLGLKTIAKRLNREGVPPPKPFVRKDESKVQPIGAWAPSTIRAILKRETYKGVYVWNRTRKRDQWGQVKQTARPESEVQRTAIESWRIVPDVLWDRVAARRRTAEGRAVRFGDGRLAGRPPKGEVRHRLAGMASCAVCGGGLVVETSPRKRGRIPEYVCFRHAHYGTCTNALRIAVSVLEEAVLQAVEEHALTPEAVEQVIQLTERDDRQDRRVALESEHHNLARQIANMVEAIASGSDIPTLVAKLRELEERKRVIDEELQNLIPIPRLEPRVVEDRLAEWRRSLRQNATQARQVLLRLLPGRIIFTPVDDGYEFEAHTRFDKLFYGVAAPRPDFVLAGDRRGTEHITARDTFDEDYGRLLERFYVKGLRPQQALPPFRNPLLSVRLSFDGAVRLAA